MIALLPCESSCSLCKQHEEVRSFVLQNIFRQLELFRKEGLSGASREIKIKKFSNLCRIFAIFSSEPFFYLQMKPKKNKSDETH